MRIFVLSADLAEWRTDTMCSDGSCGRRFAPGDVIVALEQGRDVYVRRTIFLHRRHFDDLLADGPVEMDAITAELDEIRSSVARTGLTPVEVLLAG